MANWLLAQTCLTVAWVALGLWPGLHPPDGWLKPLPSKVEWYSPAFPTADMPSPSYIKVKEIRRRSGLCRTGRHSEGKQDSLVARLALQQPGLHDHLQSETWRAILSKVHQWTWDAADCDSIQPDQSSLDL